MKRVLITPLDWGLGHATRCISIIRELQNRKCEVFIAGSGDSLELLKVEFPSLRHFSIPGYNPVYPGSGSMVWKMTIQLPKFIKTVLAEHQAIGKLISTERIDLVISDNRYGCWSAKVPSVFITHQSNILMPKKFGWLQNIVRKLNQRLMKNFTVCWLPDFPNNKNLAGELISFGKINKRLNIDFIGPLSRFKPTGRQNKKYDIAAIFSGPEPQRTLLENIVFPQLKISGLKYFVVKGIPSAGLIVDHNDCINFLTSSALQDLIESSELIIARSGYSTVMDLAALGKKAIFIPTPGQTEQQYLAKKLEEAGIAYSVEQSAFDLSTALQEAKKFSGFNSYKLDNSLLHKALDKVMEFD